jgi:hypothetical protein
MSIYNEKSCNVTSIRTVLVVGLMGILTVTGFLEGQEVDLLVSPGKLSKIHAHLSGVNNCVKCHTEGKQTDSTKCLACHKDLAARIDSGRGYHRDKKDDCITCHPEHHGEDFKLIYWNIEDFDHSETGYPLTGLHAKVTDCHSCHSPSLRLPGKKSISFLLKGSHCSTCHKDVHNGQLGQACDKCHSTATPFRNIAFDHQKTSFPLRGGHLKVDCSKCHIEKQWKGLTFSRCSDCHSDPHRPAFKKRCADCHNEDSWRVSVFDHNQTRYPLRGKHRGLACEKCHPPDKKSKKTAFSDCKDCHRVDPHKGQFERDCKTCHVVEDFKTITFNHDSSRYPLTGKHRSVACAKCHFSGVKDGAVVYKPLQTRCSDCHKDPHRGQFNKSCETCHSTAGFDRESLAFDHRKDSSYPLLGKHAQLNCEKCHFKKYREFPAGTGEAVHYRPIGTACLNCHQDYHRGQLARECRQCHGFDYFSPSVGFDHEKTRFSLKGFHEKVKCLECHKPVQIVQNGKSYETVKYVSLGAVCLDCHRGYDHSRTAFPLTGRHLLVDCRRCHNKKSPNMRRTRKTAGGRFECRHCHKSPHPGGQPNCIECHTTKNWQVKDW